MVPPHSSKVSRVSLYSGFCLRFPPFAYATFTLFGLGFPSAHSAWLSDRVVTVRTPVYRSIQVWPLPLSLATTYGISVDFFS